MSRRALRCSGVGLALLLQCLTMPSRALACVVGTGTGGSCTESALNACLPGGGSFGDSVTFNCGGAATITVTSTKTISADTTLDGESLITISGENSVGIFSVNTGVTFTVQNLTIANGNNSGGSGGGIFNNNGGTVTNSTFSGNSARWGGGTVTKNGIAHHQFRLMTGENGGGADFHGKAEDRTFPGLRVPGVDRRCRSVSSARKVAGQELTGRGIGVEPPVEAQGVELSFFLRFLFFREACSPIG